MPMGEPVTIFEEYLACWVESIIELYQCVKEEVQHVKGGNFLIVISTLFIYLVQ